MTRCEPTEELDGMTAYVNAITNPSRDDPSWPLPSFNAQDWAKAFCEIAAKNGHPGIDEGWMIGWFSNALMRGYDEHARRARPVPSPDALTRACEAMERAAHWQAALEIVAPDLGACHQALAELRAALAALRGGA